jgi:E3 ubiquitin-protein ligase HUWE1
MEAFVDHMIRWCLYWKYEDAFKAIRLGFSAVLPRRMTYVLSEDDVAQILQGDEKMDLNDLKAHTLGGDGSVVVTWMWEYLEKGGDERIRKFVRFVTGISCLPIGGFGALHKLQIVMCEYSACLFPRAHLCSYQVDLPRFPSREDLERSFDIALENTDMGIA